MKKFRYFILALVCCILVSVPVRSMAAETYGYVGDYLGDFLFVNSNAYVSLDAAYVQSYSVDLDNSDVSISGFVTDDVSLVAYEGSCSTEVQITGDVGTYLNGTLHSYVTLTCSDAISGTISISLQDEDIEDFESHVTVTRIENNKSVYLIRLSFSNFEITDDYIVIPLVFDIQYTQSVNSDHGVVVNKVVDFTFDEWMDALVQYDDIRDLPGYYGDSSRQNQQIIDSIDENTSAVNDAASYIGNKIQYYTDLLEKSIVSCFNKLTTNLSNWYNGMTTTLTNFFTPYFDNITDAFKRALSDTQATDNEVLSGAMDDYQSAEQEVFAPAMDSLTDFDFGSNDISSLGTGFIGAITFVSSCLSNMYDLTPFSAVFDVIATLALASICIGMSRLWFGKKGR